MSPTNAQIPKTTKHPYVAPSDQALLVFTRPRQRQASETPFRVVDQGGRCIAWLENGWQTTATLWPGKQKLMIISGSVPVTVQLLQAKVSSGKTYIVELRSQVNTKRPVDIRVLRRADLPLEAFPAAIKERSPFERDLRTCTEWVSWKRSKIETKAEQAKHRWDEARTEDLERYTIHRDDGWTSDEVRGR